VSTLLRHDEWAHTSDGARRIIRDGYVFIEDGLIRAVDPQRAPAMQVDQRISAAWCLLTPTLQNIYHRLCQTLTRAVTAAMRADIGQLALGMAADVAALPLRRLSLGGAVLDPLGALLFSASDPFAVLTIVGGKVLVRDGHVLEVDEMRALDGLNAARRRGIDAVQRRHRHRFPEAGLTGANV
jgi:cytosine/adenosine deaminase-related metal-dependent hydrolase